MKRPIISVYIFLTWLRWSPLSWADRTWTCLFLFFFKASECYWHGELMRTSRVCAAAVWAAVQHGSYGVQLRLMWASFDLNIVYSCYICRKMWAAGWSGYTLLLQMWPLLGADSPDVSLDCLVVSSCPWCSVSGCAHTPSGALGC